MPMAALPKLRRSRPCSSPARSVCPFSAEHLLLACAETILANMPKLGCSLKLTLPLPPQDWLNCHYLHVYLLPVHSEKAVS